MKTANLLKQIKFTPKSISTSSSGLRSFSVAGNRLYTTSSVQSNNTTTTTRSTLQQRQQYSSLFNNVNTTYTQRFYSAAADVVVKVPSMGDSISEGTVVSWNKKVGDSVRVDDVICSIETDKVTIDINATANGTIVELFAQEGDTVLVGNPLYKMSEGAAPPKAEAPKAQAPPKAEAPKTAEAPKAATPPPAPKAEAPKAAAPSTPAAASGSGEKRVKMTRIRQRTAQRLKDSQNTAAMLTTFNEVDMSALMNLRNKYKDEFEKKHSVKFGFMSAFVKASTIALKEQPIVNASVDEADIVYHDNINISVAVAAPKGLLVPVIRNCQNMSFADVEKELGRLSGLARNDQLAIEDSMGGTFTISNGGVYGSMFGTPIINPPQSAILGMHAIKDRPYVVNGQIVIRPIMYLALTYDHRIIDGREAVTFLKKIKDTLENPERILLDL
ncbi:hypothetical protein CYY_007216 [Polysphondylium violaceum]|uniref:dihydrolipoyllysine-residue succinyltransferase n=1 Tax=Polysphondylium violaceum TaxID=133409 RepID=A0A8J4PPI4_9MYCE|nr:hypothetical protein CYY_007216 [Polysphondylium violaceum]